jgi:hypothetical protein
MAETVAAQPWNTYDVLSLQDDPDGSYCFEITVI